MIDLGGVTVEYKNILLDTVNIFLLYDVKSLRSFF